MIFFGESSLHRATREFVERYHLERPHQGLGNEVSSRAIRGRHQGPRFGAKNALADF